MRRVGTSTRAQKRMARHTRLSWNFKLEHKKARKVWHHKSSSKRRTFSFGMPACNHCLAAGFADLLPLS